MTNIDLLREMGYICEDPTCTATHVDLESLPEAEFQEVED